jgi:DNA-binding MarR family transcriptional regulator
VDAYPRGNGCARAKGKQPKLSVRQQAHLVQLHEAGEHNIAELAELCSVSRPTVYRVLERALGARRSRSRRLPRD